MRKITVFMLTAACLACGECRSAASRIIQIAASDDKLIFDISAAETDVRLLEIKLNDPYDPQGDYAVLWRGKESDKISVDRFVDKKDRLYGRYILVDMAGEPVGNSRFITDLSQTTRGQLKLPRPKEKKGLSCIVNVDDAVKLGVKYMNDNLSLDMIVDLNNPNPELVYHFDDINIPINMAYIRNIDKKVKACSDAGISIFMVFANRFNKNVDRSGPLLHPRTDVKNAPMGLGAFNMASEEGIKYYIGVLEFLAQRYSRPDRKYGIISSYIIGNELQAHWTWHNMGLTGQDTVIREYLLSVRLAWLALQKYHADLRVYISLEHHWAIGGRMGDPLKEIPGKTILEKFNTWAKAEGDFPWNLAFHPYPENLFEPRFWRDKTATDNFNTDRITFKNIDVLPRFMHQEEFLFNGQVRDIALTEQGFHTKDGPDGEKVQAAAFAYSYYLVEQLPEISAYTLHRHVDHRGEGGLKLGLWYENPQASQPSVPLKKKYIWQVFQKAGTADWREAFEFANPIIGIEQWGQTPGESN